MQNRLTRDQDGGGGEESGNRQCHEKIRWTGRIHPKTAGHWACLFACSILCFLVCLRVRLLACGSLVSLLACLLACPFVCLQARLFVCLQAAGPQSLPPHRHRPKSLRQLWCQVVRGPPGREGGGQRLREAAWRRGRSATHLNRRTATA